MKNYIAPGFDHAKFIRTHEVEQQKVYWPYEWFQNFQQLDEPTLPPHKAFHSSMKKENISLFAKPCGKMKAGRACGIILNIITIWTSSRFCKL